MEKKKSMKQDQRRLSSQRHELVYAQDLSRGLLEKFRGLKGDARLVNGKVTVRVSQVRRVCRFVLKARIVEVPKVVKVKQ
jgi:hypothetical protein